MLISGRCHCGNISFALDWRPEASEIPARACTCSFCAKHGGVWTSWPTGSLTVSVKDRERVSKYAFGTKTAEFHVCTACGVVPVVTTRIDGRLYAVVSVNAFDRQFVGSTKHPFQIPRRFFAASRFHLCLRGGNNPEAIEESKFACRTYLARLMRGLPVGMVPKGQSFCIPHEDLLVLF